MKGSGGLTTQFRLRSDDCLSASVEIVRIRPEKHLVNLRTVCRTVDRMVCEGEALVLVLDVVRAG